MRRNRPIQVPAALRPLLEQPPGWQAHNAWRVAAAACRASGSVVWAARVDPPGVEPIWLEGRADSQPSIVQSECVPGLIAALEATPVGAAVEVIAPTSLRYLVEGVTFAADTPERRLADAASVRLIWARYALGELEATTNLCLSRASANLAPLRWPGAESSTGDQPSYVLYTDGGCTREFCAAAWVLDRDDSTLTERAWTLECGVARDGVRLAEFAAAVDGLASVPAGASVAVVSDHADLSDFGVRAVPAFRPSPAVADVLRALRAEARARAVRWFWAERGETGGQRRCQELIDRQLRAAPARDRFLESCRAAGLRRLFVPSFDRWLAPREPLVRSAQECWAATFERRDRFLAADQRSPRLYLRQVHLHTAHELGLAAAFLASDVAGWCDALKPSLPLAGSRFTWHARLRSGFVMVALLFEPDAGLLVQTRPGARLEDALDAASAVEHLDLSSAGS
jgi:hypothetical protein